MNRIQDEFVSNHFQTNQSDVSSGTEMGFSLLASDMQKFLCISTNVNETNSNPNRFLIKHDLGRKMCHKGKGKIRNCTDLEDLTILKCPFCSSNFSTKELLARHALRIHSKAVVNLLQEGSSQHHLKCYFCVHKVMHRHHKLLLLHLEKKHALEFVSFLKQISIPSAPANVLTETSNSQDYPTTGHLDQALQNMSLSGVMKNKEVESTFNTSAESQNFLNCNSQENNAGPCSEIVINTDCVIQSNFYVNQFCAKRKLVLDDSSSVRSDKAFVMKENLPPKESLCTTLARSGWDRAAGNHFACGRCKEAFSCNALLLDHVSVRHRGPLRLLQPLFTCGLCSASFYKNSFLVRHCFRHHTPKRTPKVMS